MKRSMGATAVFALSSVAGIAALAIPFAAQAADLKLKAPPPPVVINDWSGGYFGVEAGWKEGRTDWSTTCLSASVNGSDCGTLANPFFVDASSPVTLTSSGGRVGGYLGANLQVSPTWVLGVEGDIAWYDKTTTVAGVVGCSIFCGFSHIASPNDSTAVRLTWDGSVRGRIGYLVTPDVMFYGTGGFAGQWMQETVTCGSTGLWCGANRSQTQSQTFIVGWTAGGGIEWKFGHWMVRGEYRYNEFQSQNIFFFAGTPDFIAATVKPKTQMATFGLAYKF